MTDKLPAELTVAAVPDTRYVVPFSDKPGFKIWMLNQYAFGTTTRRIKERLDEIIAGQIEDGAETWPSFSRRKVDEYRTVWQTEWLPVQHRISAQIENQGVLAKNQRLLALLRLAEDIEEKMWMDSERSASSQRYLLKDYRDVLKQIAEEKGELGESEHSADPVLARIALNLSEALRVQGSGIQQTIDGEAFDYFPEEEGDYEEVDVRGESPDLQGDGVPAE